MYLYVKMNWDANRFLPIESKDCMNSISYEYILVKTSNRTIYIHEYNGT